MTTPTKLRAVIFDWAGTVVDFGSRAPMGAFVEAFGQFGVEIGIDEARAPMGLAKRDHIQAILATPRVKDAWAAARGGAPTQADIDAVYDVFVPMNAAVVVDYAELIPGAAEVAKALRARGLKIGSTTGYTREIMAPLLPLARDQGFEVDCLVCAGDTAEGRPSPLMIYRCFLELGVWPASACVKVDDTPVGIEEGRNAGCWTVGVTDTGNEVGLSLEEWTALDDADRETRRTCAAETLRAAGAHAVIPSVAELMPCLEEFETRLARGCSGRESSGAER